MFVSREHGFCACMQQAARWQEALQKAMLWTIEAVVTTLVQYMYS